MRNTNRHFTGNSCKVTFATRELFIERRIIGGYYRISDNTLSYPIIRVIIPYDVNDPISITMLQCDWFPTVQ